VKRLIKQLLYTVAPEWTTALISARARAHSHRVVAAWGCGPVVRKLIRCLGNRVQAGPFTGLALTPMTHAEQLGPYLLGTYESELAPAWELVLQRSYPQIIDVGAKFGYYAVGLARRYPHSTVVAFDTDWWARKAIREMIAANAVRNVKVEGYCSPAWLASHATDGALVISDCEGYENVLFDDTVVARLRSATLIIETHDIFAPGVSDRLSRAFAGTHIVRTFRSGQARIRPPTVLDFLTDSERRLALEEARIEQAWLLCFPVPA
jgi:hypothetical protein